MNAIIIGLGILNMILLIIVVIKCSKKNKTEENERLNELYLKVHRDLGYIFNKLNEHNNIIENSVASLSRQLELILVQNKDITNTQISIKNQIESTIKSIQGAIYQSGNETAKTIDNTLIERMNKLQNSIIESLTSVLKGITDTEKELTNSSTKNNQLISDSLVKITAKMGEIEKGIAESNTTNIKTITSTLNENLTRIEGGMSERLDAIENNVNTKLDESLNQRLDASFKQVGDRLEALYKSLGELSNLQDGVSSLNRTLSNVKTRGMFGEAQLEQLLASVFGEAGRVYDKNVSTKEASRDVVEFGVKIPDSAAPKGFRYLPIDSKFHVGIYESIIAASEDGNAELLKQNQIRFQNALKKDAQDIHDKYIDPVNTIGFAIMYLPTEGLYAEALRSPGLTEQLQKDYQVVVAGPTTLIALLNSFAVGFSYMKLNEDAKEIEHSLGMFKTEFTKFDTYISKTKKKLTESQHVIEELERRSRVTQRKLKSITAIDYEESKEELGITDDIEQSYEMISDDDI